MFARQLRGGERVGGKKGLYKNDGKKDRAVALMRRVEAGVQASMSYCINRAILISCPFLFLGVGSASPLCGTPSGTASPLSVGVGLRRNLW